MRLTTALAASGLLAAALVVPGAPALTVSASHAPSHFLPGMVAAYATITVSNSGDGTATGPVTVTDVVPPSLTPTVAAGEGWTCTAAATTTCTRHDALAPRSSYPPIRIVVDVSGDVPAEITNTASVAFGRDAGARAGSATDTIAARDACPYGWSPEQNVTFAPPFRPGRPGGIDSGVRNPERPDGCTLLDRIWSAEPFGSHAAFVSTVRQATAEFAAAGLLTRTGRRAIVSAAARSDVATERDHQVANTCSSRVALTFDDGTSSYRPQLLQLLRDEQVHATFFDNGVRVQANPQWARFQAHEGHVELNHTFTHIHMDELPAGPDREEVLHNEAVLAAAGAPITFKGIRPPFGGSNPDVQRLLIEMGYTFFLNRINGEDWLPDKSAEAIRDDILAQVAPGVIIGMHDGPIDTPAGAATLVAAREIIDTLRQMGFCFGVVDRTGHVVADRYVSSGEPIPGIVHPVPYHLPLAFGTRDRIPQPWVRIPSPIRVAAAHAPSTFRPGGTARLRLAVGNRSDRPTDGGMVTVEDVVPAGLTATAVHGSGWTCSGAETIDCTRSDVLVPHASYPPITITVSVAGDAPAAVTNAVTLSGHGETWTAEASDPIHVHGGS